MVCFNVKLVKEKERQMQMHKEGRRKEYAWDTDRGVVKEGEQENTSTRFPAVFSFLVAFPLGLFHLNGNGGHVRCRS